MAKRRIPTKASELRDVLLQASAAVASTPSWPPQAPQRAQLDAAALSLSSKILEENRLEGQLKTARGALQDAVDLGFDLMQRVDEMTDGLFGPYAAEKANYGLPPKKSTHGESVPLVEVILRKVEDGPDVGSIFLDWEVVDGAAAYQVVWFSDAAMAQQVGDASVSRSEYTITGLTPGHQYWARVRAIRGDDYGPWSDPATRVANI